MTVQFQLPSKDSFEEELARRGMASLTPREETVLELIVRGATNKEIGRSLDISPRTVEVHRLRILDKLGAKNAAQLAFFVGTYVGRRMQGN